jgi:hypothetical protein
MTTPLENKIQTILPFLNESLKRKYLASEAIALGKGGIKIISEISGVHRNTIGAGIKELSGKDKTTIPSITTNSTDSQCEEKKERERIRAPGGGRKSIVETQPDILDALERIVDPVSYGDPTRPLRYTVKSLRTIAECLQKDGYIIKKDKVADLLKLLGYSLQQNQKMKQVGKESEYRSEQFEFINARVTEYLNEKNPVISVDCKKKENVGNFKNNGSVYRPSKDPIKVLDHDFPLKELGKAVPYGVYDIGCNEGYVSVGVSADTAMFAVTTIKNWWYTMGKEKYEQAQKIYITADGGGSNGSRCKLWKVELQKLSDEIQLPIEVSHFPPGTSKWNKIEHRLFSQISRNWKGQPLVSLEVIVELIASTTTNTGLTVKSFLDKNEYPTGIRVTDEELNGVNLVRNEFCGQWNYTIYPVSNA